jgi:Raf kinase inhibitor-like YbhB/YbcL family protein
MVSVVRYSTVTVPLTLGILAISCLAGRAMELTSPDIASGAKLSLAQVHTRCGGQNRSPALRWSGAPAGAQSFAVTLFDPDAGGGAGFWHWLIFDVPAGTTELPEGAGAGNRLPSGTEQAANDFGDSGYGGACPPSGSGVHHYEFTLYALGVPKASLDKNANGAAITAYLKAHSLTTATLVGTYSR